MKKVTISAKPRQEKPAPSVDQWVQSRTAEEETKRVTIDIPKSLHTRIRIDCLQRSVSMTDELRKTLVEHYSKLNCM